MDVNIDVTTFISWAMLVGICTIMFCKLIFHSPDQESKKKIFEKVTKTVSWCDRQDRSNLGDDENNEKFVLLLSENPAAKNEEGEGGPLYLAWIKAVVRQDSVEVFVEYLSRLPYGLRRYVRCYVKATLAEFRRQGIEALEAKVDKPIDLKDPKWHNED